MATDLILVSATSTEMIFSGNMYKAPPLDRKKRKKWHERHFVLRANRTLELYKSMKAAESHKTPRRIIDLRECISLEIGLEYRNYEHILSLGTFKRTFFFAAPSDALMLQWANVLEKTKNAQDGESIEVLDIGLRKTGGVPVVHRVKPLSPTHRFSVGSPGRYNVINNHKGISMGHFTRDSAETVNLRGSDQPISWTELQGNDLLSPQRASSFTASFETPNHAAEASTSPPKHAKSPHRVPLKLRARLSNDSHSSQSSQATSTTTESSQFDRPSSLSSQQSFTVSPNHTHASQGHMISPAMLSGRVPPPVNIIAPAKRNEDGFFVNQKKPKGSGEEQVDHASRPEEESGGSGNVSFRSKTKGTQGREFVVKDGALQRYKPGRNIVRSPRRKLPNDRRKGQNSLSPKHEAMSQNSLTTGNDFKSNMKRSFRYRMITLRAEKPIFVDKIRENSDSEDEDEEGQGISKGRHELPATLVPGPQVQKQKPTFSPKRRVRQEKRTEDAQRSSQPNQRLKVEPEPKDDNLIGQRRANSYSKLTVTGVKSQPIATNVMLPEHISSRLNAKKRQRSNSQSDILESNKSQLISNITSLSQDDILMESTINDNAAAAQMLTGFPLDEVDVFDVLPARPPSDGFMYSSRTSLSSLDNIIEPPDMFNEGDTVPCDCYTETGSAGMEPRSEQEPSRGTNFNKRGSATGLKRPVPKARSKVPNQPAVRQFHVGHMTIKPSHVTSTNIIYTNSKPLQLNKTNDTLDPNLVDRNSTESNDTGYTSGASPSYVAEDKNTTQNGMQEFKLEFKDESETISDIPPVSTPQSGLPTRDYKGKLGSSDKQLSVQLSQTSITSTSSDYVRFYVPIIFYKPGSKVERARVVSSSSPTGGGSNMFSLQVCLVEDSEDLMKDLMSVKSLEGYTVVECDEIEGSNNVSYMGDDFTVETALEDLEFGFTVIKSTQKDLFVRKVRQFHFEIQKLFGSSKPFSCDVVVRHADQITVLSIEVDMKS